VRLRRFFNKKVPDARRMLLRAMLAGPFPGWYKKRAILPVKHKRCT
jgi:hypothetical protein